MFLAYLGSFSWQLHLTTQSLEIPTRNTTSEAQPAANNRQEGVGDPTVQSHQHAIVRIVPRRTQGVR